MRKFLGFKRDIRTFWAKPLRNSVARIPKKRRFTITGDLGQFGEFFKTRPLTVSVF